MGDWGISYWVRKNQVSCSSSLIVPSLPQVNSRSLVKRGQAVFQTAKLLSGSGGLQEHEDVKLLFGEVFRQHEDLFMGLLSNPKSAAAGARQDLGLDACQQPLI